MRSTTAAVISGAIAAIVPLGLATGQVVLNRGFEAGDLVPFGIWSAPFGVIVAVLSWLLVEITLDLPQQPRYVAGAVVGVGAGWAYTILVAVFLGLWMGAWGFPVLLYWAFGGIVALSLAVRLTVEPSA